MMDSGNDEGRDIPLLAEEGLVVEETTEALESTLPRAPLVSEVGRLVSTLSDRDAEEREGDEEWWKSFKTSYIVLALLSLTDTVEYGLIIPSLWSYMEEMSQHKEQQDLHHAYGLVLSSFSAASLVTKPFLGYLADRRPYLETFVWSTVVAVAGNILYFLTSFINSRVEHSSENFFVLLLLLARILSGVGCANTSLTFAYVARTAPSTKRTKFMTVLSLSKVAGFVLGPALNVITSLMKFNIGSLKVDPKNSPGLFVAIVQVILVVVLLAFLKEPLPYESGEDVDEESGSGRVKSKKQRFSEVFSVCSLPVSICFLNIIGFNFMIGCVEAIVVPITTTAFGWTPLQNSYVYLVITAVALLNSMTVMSLSSKVEDRTFVLAACLFAIAGPSAVHFLFYYDMPTWHFWIGTATWAMPMSIGFPSNRSLFSRLIESSHHQAFLSSFLSVFASLGGLLGPYWAGLTLGSRPEGKDHVKVAPVAVEGCLVLGLLLFTCNLVVLFLIPSNQPILVHSQPTSVSPVESDSEQTTVQQT